MTDNDGESPGAHRGRKFRPKRLKTSLPRPDAEAPLPPPKAAERIAKVMARAGVASRREAEVLIAAGRVTVNGEKISSPALNVTAKDRVAVDGKPMPQRERTRLFMFHKPRGLVTTSADTHGRPTIFGGLPEGLPRLISIGRLDLNTEGLLLLTNDGGLARALELPSTGWLRRYRVRAFGTVAQAQLDALKNGIEVDGVRYGAIEATFEREQGSNVWLSFAMREGKNREIRNVLRALGLQVNRLIRVSYGPFQLGELPDGAVEEIKTRTLRDQIGDRLAALAGADFASPLNEAEPAPRRAPKPMAGEDRRAPAVTRHPEARAQRASKGDGPGAAAPRSRPRQPSRDESAKDARKPFVKFEKRKPGHSKERTYGRPDPDRGGSAAPGKPSPKSGRSHRPYRGKRDR